MLTQTRVKQLLYEWSYWLGTDRKEILTSVGYGKHPIKIFMDRAAAGYSGINYYTVENEELMQKVNEIIVMKLKSKQKKIIIYRYHKNFETLKQVAEKIGISISYCHHLHSDALNILDKEIQKFRIATGCHI